MNEQTLTLNRPIIKLSVLRSLLVIIIFTALGLALPWLCHQFKLAGPAFLPMHFFVLLSGLLFGWRIGLIVGLTTPFTSYFISGMPLINILPVITLEIGAYGFFAGLFQEKFKIHSWNAMVLALILGKITILIASYIFLAGEPFNYLINVVRTGLPGIAMQFALIPFMAKILKGVMQ